MQTARSSLGRLALLAALLGAAAPATGCAIFEPQSKIRSGQTFQTGQAQYDDYFSKVHALQEAAAGWTDEKKAARRNLIDALKIATDSPDVTIVEAAHERMAAIAHIVGNTRLDLREDDGKIILASEGRADSATKDFITALQATVDGEMKRKKELRDVPQRCDELSKVGRDLEPHVKDDFFRQGGTMMADVHDEIKASYDVLGQISKTARLERRETEDFISDLARAVDTGPGDYIPPSHGSNAAAKPTAAHPTPAATTPTPATTTNATSAPKPKPKPKPQSSGGGDDFNP